MRLRLHNLDTAVRLRQAGLEAGIVKPTFTCPTDPERAARLIRKHLTKDQIHELMERLS